MALIELTVNVDRLASALETAIPVLSRIAAALDRAFPPPADRSGFKPAGPEAHHRVTPEVIEQRRRDAERQRLTT